MNLTPTYFQTSRAYLIGIENYDNLTRLSTPFRDIDDIHASLLLHEFEDANILKKKDATQDDIRAIVSKMIDEIGFKDRVVFYFAGHGVAHDSGDIPRGFLIPREGQRADETTFVDMDWLAKKFSRLRCKHFLLILDCCFAGSFRWFDNYRDGGLDQTKKIFREKFERFVSDETQAWHVLTSSSYDEEAIDQLLNLGAREDTRKVNRNSPFASAVINALTGKANNYFESGIITATRLYNYVDEYVANYLRENGVTQRQSPNYFLLKRSTKGQFVFLAPELAGSVIGNLPRLNTNNPYKGLASFKTSDSYLFFGRRQAIERLKALVLKAGPQEVVLVTGSSGLGKSSLVMAGLIPAVLQQYPDSSFVPPIRPGDIKGKSDYLHQCYKDVSSTKNPFILFIDQFEEMITICSEKERALWEEFIQNSLQKKNCRVVISLRSDFEPQLKENAIVRSGFKNKFVVTPFERQEIRDIITQPALQSVIQIEAISKEDGDANDLIERICDEAMQSTGSLPLLSFALEQWYKVNVERSANRYLLKEEYYNGIGGVNGALGTIIDGFISGLRNSVETENLKRLMLRMATVKDDGFSRAKVYEFELDAPGSNPEARGQRELLEELIKLRIVTTNRRAGNVMAPGEQIYYEPAHDAVLTSWKQLWEWLNAEKINIPVYRQLSEDTQKWRAGKYRRSLLWAEGANLYIVGKEFQKANGVRTKLQRFGKLMISMITYGQKPAILEKPNLFNLEERRFIKASLLRVRQIQARLNILILAVVAIGIAAIVFAVNANIQRRRVVRETRRSTAVILANNTDNQEPATAYYSLKKADSLDPENPIVLEDIFKLITDNTVSCTFVPAIIIPLHQDPYQLSFEDDSHLTVVPKSDESYQVDLHTGKLADLHNRPGLDFPDHPAGFLLVRAYDLDTDINRCDGTANQAVIPSQVPGARFLMISPSHITLGEFLGRAGLIITRDSCLSDGISFSHRIIRVKFLRDTTSAILVGEDKSIYLADFLNGKVLELIRGYNVDRTAHYYNLSDDERMFAAVNRDHLIYVWDLKKANEFSSNGQEIRDSIFRDVQNVFELGTNDDNNMRHYDMSLNGFRADLTWPNNGTLLSGRSPMLDEFVLAGDNPKLYVINNKDVTPRFELPTENSLNIFYSKNGEKIFYTTLRDSLVQTHVFGVGLESPFPDSIIAEYPSLKKIESFLHAPPTITSDTIPDHF